MGGDPVFLHLRKIPPASTSEHSLSQVLENLWSTRKTGLGPAQKPYIQSLLGLPALQDLDPVLACLRLLIRKCVHENLTRADIQRLFPPDIPIERVLVVLLQKYHGQWKEEALRDQPLWQRKPIQVKTNAPPALTPFPMPKLSSTLWPRQDEETIPSYADSNLPPTGPTPLNRDNGSLDNLEILPRLKLMTWTMQNRHSTPADRVAIISLKLQDYTKSPSGEIEVKFQLSKDTLEAMLRSMTYISEQLSNLVSPASKKQRQ